MLAKLPRCPSVNGAGHQCELEEGHQTRVNALIKAWLVLSGVPIHRVATPSSFEVWPVTPSTAASTALDSATGWNKHKIKSVPNPAGFWTVTEV